MLDEEPRNNGACRLARDALAAMAERTGAPEALEAFIHSLGGPKPTSDFVREMADRFTAEALEWLRARTGQTFGPDAAAWRRWYEANAPRLRWDPSSGRFSAR